jgi:hypothetical protein
MDEEKVDPNPAPRKRSLPRQEVEYRFIGPEEYWIDERPFAETEVGKTYNSWKDL